MKRLTQRTQHWIRQALREDIGNGDATSNLLIPAAASGEAWIIARSKGFFCGEALTRALLRITDPKLKAGFKIWDGRPFLAGKKLIQIRGPVRSILKAERTLLNFLAHLCGVAAYTQAFVRKAKPYRVRIMDTRKTTPLWRELEKAAVRSGGGHNHRMGLYDALFVKDNHRRLGELGKLKQRKGAFVLEARNHSEVREALRLNPKVLLLDNYTPVRLRRAVKAIRRVRPSIILEASGGINLQNVAHYARSGVNQLSVGALTQSAPPVNFSLLI